MLTLKTIEEKLSIYQPGAVQGDHFLNPDLLPKPPYRAAAVLIALLPRGDDLSVVFTQRTSHLHAHAGQVSFPGGGREPQDENAVATALREAEEEIGLDPAAVRVLGQLDEYITRSGFSVHPIVGYVSDVPTWQPDSFEVEEVFDVPLQYICTPGHLSRQQMEREGVVREFYACNWEKFRIWGATAGMLRNFLDVVTGAIGQENRA